MTFQLIVPPKPIWTVAEAKRHLNVLHDDDDLYIDGLIEAVTSWADGPEGWLGRCLAPQTWDWRLDAVACAPWYDPDAFGYRSQLVLPMRPVLAVDSIAYVDADGAPQTWAENAWDLLGAGQGVVGGAAAIQPIYNGSWPSVRSQREAVTIRVQAGYAQGDGQSPEGLVEAIPFAIKAGLQLFLGELYENRSAAAEPSAAVTRLLAPFQVYR